MEKILYWVSCNVPPSGGSKRAWIYQFVVRAQSVDQAICLAREGHPREGKWSAEELGYDVVTMSTLHPEV